MNKITLFLLPILVAAPLTLSAQPQTSHFLIGNKSFERTLFSCVDTPGCFEENNQCRWDVSTCFKQCKTTPPWDDDPDNCQAVCMKHSATISAFEDYPEIKHSVVESICIQYHEPR